MATHDQSRLPIRIVVPQLGDGRLKATSFEAVEAISELFSVWVEAFSDEPDLDLDSVLGQPATLSIRINEAGADRHFSGIVASMAQLGSDRAALSAGAATEIHRYAIEIRPKAWLLTQRKDCRIFQNKSLPDILKEVLGGAGIDDVEYQLQGPFEKREFCVQYRETDFDFVSRLMEEEGAFHYFKHSAGKHRWVIADQRATHLPCPVQDEYRFDSNVRDTDESASVTAFRFDRRFVTGKVAHTDYNFEQGPQRSPSTLMSKYAGPSPAREDRCEDYDYPGGFLKKAEGDRLAKIRQAAYAATREIAKGSSNGAALCPGFRFRLAEHPRSAFNKEFLLLSVRHSGEQQAAFEGGAARYDNSFRAMPSSTPFRPLQLTPKPRVYGTQTAKVVGKSGEEIWTDEYRRVKVQFHWDRAGSGDEHSSCFVRVAQPFSGAGYGVLFTPRIGHEVVVDFLEGDPDRPIIIGAVHHAENRPPYDQNEPTKNTIKDKSSKNGGDDNFNELRFEAKKGSEEIYLQGEKDMNVLIKNDLAEEIQRDAKLKIGRHESTQIAKNRTEEVGGDESIEVKGGRKEKVGKDEAVEIGTNRGVKVGANDELDAKNNWTLKAGMNGEASAGMNFTIKAGMTLTLQGAGGKIVIGPTGIEIQGMMVTIKGSLVQIN